jgi:hypothetical protein
MISNDAIHVQVEEGKSKADDYMCVMHDAW